MIACNTPNFEPLGNCVISTPYPFTIVFRIDGYSTHSYLFQRRKDHGFPKKPARDIFPEPRRCMASIVKAIKPPQLPLLKRQRTRQGLRQYA